MATLDYIMYKGRLCKIVAEIIAEEKFFEIAQYFKVGRYP
jgi:hypothetical protein